jgi:hypothetical protein
LRSTSGGIPKEFAITATLAEGAEAFGYVCDGGGYFWTSHSTEHRMPQMGRSRLALVSMIALMCLGLAGCSSEATTTSAAASPSPSSLTVNKLLCVGDPHAHVYSPDRLQLLASCVAVTGTIDLESAQADGDYHVRLHLDPGQTCGGQPCLDAENLSQQGGDLILEPVCENPITQADAMAACQGYHNPLVIPPVGSHVTVTGPFVLDTNHGWREIHPLESITVDGVTIPSPSPTPPPAPSPTPAIAPAPAALTVTITASSYGLVAATTLPGASCTAKAKLPSGRFSTAAGLLPTVVAGPDGGVSWSYRTVSTTTKGTGTHTVTCTLNGATVSASAAFTVA